MGKSQRDKGAGYEREIVQEINSRFPPGFHAKRRLGQARDAGHDIEWIERFILEAKRRKTQVAKAWLDQAQAATAPGQIPVVVHRGDGGKSVAMIYFSDLLDLIYELIVNQVVRDLVGGVDE